MFSPFLNTTFLSITLVESGEKLLNFMGFHGVALDCFTRYQALDLNQFDVSISASNTSLKQGSTTDNSSKCLKNRADYGVLLAEFLRLRSTDSHFRMKESGIELDRILKSAASIMMSASNDPSLSRIVFDGTWHIYNITNEMNTSSLWKKVFSVLSLSLVTPISSCCIKRPRHMSLPRRSRDSLLLANRRDACDVQMHAPMSL